MAQVALCWILDFDAVSTVTPVDVAELVRDNVEASEEDPLPYRTHGAIRDIYEDVHRRW